MAVKITEQMYDTFTNNGYTEDDIKNTVNHYREQGMPDSAIFTNMNKKYREIAGIKDVVTPQMGDQPNYDTILNDPSLNPQQQAEQIKQKGEAYRAGLDKDLATQKAKMYTGATIKIASPLVGLGLAPFTGGMSIPASMATLGLAEGTTFGVGEALQNQKRGGEFAKDVATQGLLGGVFGAGTGALFKGAGKVLPRAITKVKDSVWLTASKIADNIDPNWSMSDDAMNTMGSKVFNAVKNSLEGSQPMPTAQQLGLDDIQYEQILKQLPTAPTARLPKENIQEIAPTVTTTPTGETQLNLGLQAVKQPTLKEEPVKEGFVRLYRGLTNEFDPKYNKSKLDNINGYESWTDNYDLAKAYGDKVYHIDVPKSKIASDVIDENPKSMTYGDRNLLYKHDKPVGIKGESGNEYMLYTAHDDYGTLKYNKVNQPQANVPEMVQPQVPTNEIFYTPEGIEVIKNPTPQQHRELTKKYKETMPRQYWNEPNTRVTYDELGNEYRWVSYEAPHGFMEPFLEQKTGSKFNQDITMLHFDKAKQMGVRLSKLNDYRSAVENGYRGTFESYALKEIKPQANVPEMVQPQVPTTTKQTKLSESVQSAKGLPTDIKKTIKQNAPTYESMTNNDLIMTASDAIDKDLMGNLSDIMAKDKFNAFDVERTRQIAKRLNAQNTPEANETLINLLDKASEQASKSGQAVQAFSLWNNLTPEGAILKTNKLLNEYNKRFGKNLKLTQEQINNITKLQETAQALPDGYDKDVALAKSLKYQQSIIPKSLGSKIKTYRNISLLLNLKTLGRNVVGNALFNIMDTASKTLAVPIDKAMGAFTKTHTRALPQIGESLKGFKLGAERGFKEAMQGINTADVSSRYDLQGGKVFKSKVGQAFETALDLGLRVPDRAFYNSVYAESLANQLKASGLKEPTTKMIEQAGKEALECVFQNKSKLSDITLGLRQQFNRVGSKEFGLGDLLIPYAQTPANLAQQGINYSPLGLLKAGASLKGGNQRQASLDIARALVGTGIGAAGYGAVKAGQATGSLETGKGYQQDLRLRKNMELLGIRPQQVGDISYSQFQPASIPFSVGAATATGESPTQAGINTLLDLPFLQNYNKIMSDVKQDGIAQAGANFAASIPSQFVPTLLGQINQAFDNTTRETYSPNKLQQGLNVAGAKFPFVAQTLPERVNVKGEPIQRYESTGVTRLSDVFLNPTFINKKKDDVVIKEMNKLYQETGEIAPLLPVAQRTIKVNGEQKKLTGKEVNKYQKEVGKISYYLRKKAIESDSFKSMNSDEQIDYLNKMNKGVTQAVKIMMFNDSPKKIQPFAQEIIDNYDTFTK